MEPAAHAAVKTLAELEGKTISSIVRSWVELWLGLDPRPAARHRVRRKRRGPRPRSAPQRALEAPIPLFVPLADRAVAPTAKQLEMERIAREAVDEADFGLRKRTA